MNYSEKYKKEISYIKDNCHIDKPDEEIGLSVDTAINIIQNYLFEDYKEDKHFSALVRLVANGNRLTKDVKNILGLPSLRVL